MSVHLVLNKFIDIANTNLHCARNLSLRKFLVVEIKNSLSINIW